MSDRLVAVLVLACLVFPAGALRAETAADPVVTILDLPFKARAMRGPGSEVAVSVATSGLVPGVRPGAATAAGEEADDAAVVVVWGDEGGAALSLVDGTVRVTRMSAEAVEGLVAAETPRGALPGIRRAVSGGLSATLTGPTRAVDGGANASGLTIRERQPMTVSAEPKPVVVTTSLVPAGTDAVFAPRRPRLTRIGGQPAFVTVTLHPGGRSGLALVGRHDGTWGVIAQGAPQEGGGLKVAAVADFSTSGQPQVVAVKAPDGAGTLQLWTVSGGALALAGEAPGYAAGAEDADLAATLDIDRDTVPELALPVADRSAIALLSLKGGISERARIPLPAPAGFGLAVLGKGPQGRVLVGLDDGRIAVAPVPGVKP